MNIPNANRYQTQQAHPNARQRNHAAGERPQPHPPEPQDDSDSVWGWIVAAVGITAAVGAVALVIAHPVITAVGVGTLAYAALKS